MLIFEVIWADFVPPAFFEGFSGRKSRQNVPLEPRKPLISLGRYAKSMVFAFFEKDAKKDAKAPPPRGGKMEVKIAGGAPQDDEKWSKNFSGAPRAKSVEFFFAPGGLQAHSGDEFLSVLAAPWGPLGPQVVPGGLPEASRRSFRSFSAQFGLHFCIVFGYFCSCSRSRLGTSAIVFLIRSVSCSYSFSLACSCSLFVFGRLRSLKLENWKPSIPEALGGRRGSRSDMN